MSKILHVMLVNFFIEGAGYQENLLPKFHKLQGHEVYIVTNHNDWTKKPIFERQDYINPDGIIVTILPSKKMPKNKHLQIIRGICSRKVLGFYKYIEKLKPEIIFVHGAQGIDNLDVVKYKLKNSSVRVFVDSHSDYYNTPIKTISNRILYKGIFRYFAKKLYSVCETFWGVTPWRVDYLRDVFDLPEEKTKLLVMGGDDSLIDYAHKDKIRTEFRLKHNIADNEYVIVTGGKIDRTKNIHLLIEALGDNEKIRLVVFGKPSNDFESEIENLMSKYPRVINIGWVDSSDVYKYFLAADLAFFPGTHSVLWEQAAACGIPLVVKKWAGMQHINVGGNCRFLEDVTVESIKSIVVEIFSDDAITFKDMKKIAEGKAREEFLYSNIAKRAIEE